MQLFMADTTGTQGYIFGSNRLRENIGASHLVAQATESWALETIRAVAPQSNVKEDLTLDSSRRIEVNALDIEVIYTGGGNVLALFKDEPQVQSFARIYSRQLLCQAPGLDVPMAWRAFDITHDKLAATLDDLARDLKQKKRSRAWSSPLLGLGVTQACHSTGMPAVATRNMGTTRDYPVSAEILAKHEVWQEADSRFQKIADPAPYTYPHELDDLGRSEGEHSYIAVVHADSNNMGDRIKKITQNATSSRAAIEQLRQFSRALDQAGQTALAYLVDLLKNNVQSSQIAHLNDPDLFVPLPWKNRDPPEHYLPFRPLVAGGDDITFVCDGRLGLSLALAFLREFERLTANLPDGQGSASACAGVAIVKSHYPFARAYALAEELCGQAKHFRRQHQITGACLDWHYATSGLAESITAIREREYQGSKLTLKSLSLDASGGLHAWPVVEAALNIFQKPPKEGGWAGKRNKLKALREALREGSGAVEWFLAKYGGELPPLPAGGTELSKLGWEGDYCAYFDAVEATDWYIPL